MFAIAGNAPSGYNLTRSLRFRASASAYLSRTLASSGSQTTWTYSTWIKKGAKANGTGAYHLLEAGTNETNYCSISLQNDGDGARLAFYQYTGSYNFNLVTSAAYRDYAGWYHIVVAFDTTQATASDRIKIYVNGSQVTAFSTATYPSLNYTAYINNASYTHAIGRIVGYTATDWLDGYLAETNFIGGLQLTASSFGSTNSTTGVWQPAKYTGTYGTNGFYLPFTDNSALTTSSNVGLGKDFSGNGNYWTTNNISITSGVTYDSMTDVPTLTSATAANFSVLNILPGGYGGSVTDGNLKFSRSAAAWGTRLSSIFPTSGKFYFEAVGLANTASQGVMVGVSSFQTPEGSYIGSGNSYAYYATDGRLYANSTNVALGATWTDNDIIGVAIDIGAGTLAFYKNNVQQGSTITGLSGGYYLGVSSYGSSSVAINYGQQPFTSTPPNGFKSLNTYNLPDSTIKQGRKHMDSTLWIGDGSTSKPITNAAAFRPGFVWGKRRDAAGNHNLYDEIRGATNYLTSNGSGAEIAGVTGLTSFNSDGFSIGSHPDLNTSGGTFVGHQWKAGEGITTVNTAGSITSTVSVNASAGFSIVSLTGPASGAFTAGHGLGIAPSLIIAKIRNGTGGWPVYHAALGATGALQLESTGAFNVSAGYWNNTAPTSTVFTSNIAWGATQQIYYCWAEVPGFSKFGSFQGNGSADGPFVYTGFRPKWIMFKNYAAGGYSAGWTIIDTARSTYNVAVNCVQVDTSAAEFTYVTPADILSNGFKIRTAWDSVNNPSPIAYIAFAENPFKNSLAR